MSNELPAFAQVQPVPATDSVARGCFFGCLCQLAFFGLGLLTIFVSNGKLQNAIFVGWGVTQWIGLVPLILRNKKQQNFATVQGLIISGALGVILSSACAAMVFSG